MTPRMKAQLAHLFSLEAELVIGETRPDGAFIGHDRLVEYERLRAIADELASDAEKAGQRTGTDFCF